MTSPTNDDERMAVLRRKLSEQLDADTSTVDYGADLLADGFTFTGIANALGVTRQTATDRFAVLPGKRERARAIDRARLWVESGAVRVSVVDRRVVFYDGDRWRVLRSTSGRAAAWHLCSYLGDCAEFRAIRTPGDLAPEGVAPWALPWDRLYGRDAMRSDDERARAI